MVLPLPSSPLAEARHEKLENESNNFLECEEGQLGWMDTREREGEELT